MINFLSQVAVFFSSGKTFGKQVKSVFLALHDELCYVNSVPSGDVECRY